MLNFDSLKKDLDLVSPTHFVCMTFPSLVAFISVLQLLVIQKLKISQEQKDIKSFFHHF